MPRSTAPMIAEPTAVWRVRPALVVDCSVVVAALFEEAGAEDNTQVMAGHSLHAPALLPFEFANVARSKVKAGAPARKVEVALQTFADLRIELHSVPVAALHALALACELSACDAAYLWVAASVQAPLATLDQRLLEAAQRHLGSRG